MRLIVLAIIMSISTPLLKKDDIRALSKRYESYTQINGIIEFYASCYYKLPENLKQIYSFLDDWKKNAPESYLFDKYGTDIIEGLRNDLTYSVFSPDSVFVFNNNGIMSIVKATYENESNY